MTALRMNRKLAAWFAASVMLLASAISATATAGPGSDNWTYSADIYAWGPDIKATTATGGDIDITLHDLIESLNMTFMGGVGAYKGKWSLFADVIYLDIEADDSFSESVPVLGPISLDVEIDADVELKAFISTLGGTYNVVDNEKASVNLLGGARHPEDNSHV